MDSPVVVLSAGFFDVECAFCELEPVIVVAVLVLEAEVVLLAWKDDGI